MKRIKTYESVSQQQRAQTYETYERQMLHISEKSNVYLRDMLPLPSAQRPQTLKRRTLFDKYHEIILLHLLL